MKIKIVMVAFMAMGMVNSMLATQTIVHLLPRPFPAYNTSSSSLTNYNLPAPMTYRTSILVGTNRNPTPLEFVPTSPQGSTQKSPTSSSQRSFRFPDHTANESRQKMAALVTEEQHQYDNAMQERQRLSLLSALEEEPYHRSLINQDEDDERNNLFAQFHKNKPLTPPANNPAAPVPPAVPPAAHGPLWKKVLKRVGIGLGLSAGAILILETLGELIGFDFILDAIGELRKDKDKCKNSSNPKACERQVIQTYENNIAIEGANINVNPKIKVITNSGRPSLPGYPNTIAPVQDRGRCGTGLCAGWEYGPDGRLRRIQDEYEEEGYPNWIGY